MSESTAHAEPTEPPEAEPTQPTEVDWEAEAKKWEARAKGNSAKIKEYEPIVSQWKALEEASKTELQRQQEETARWQSEAQTWRTQAVSSRVERLAADRFADPSDALTAIDASSYLGAGGEIDESRITADLDALLERKPHWRKQAAQPSAPRVPAPNPAQGGGAQGTAATDPAQQFAALIRSQLGT